MSPLPQRPWTQGRGQGGEFGQTGQYDHAPGHVPGQAHGENDMPVAGGQGDGIARLQGKGRGILDVQDKFRFEPQPGVQGRDLTRTSRRELGPALFKAHGVHVGQVERAT